MTADLDTLSPADRLKIRASDYDRVVAALDFLLFFEYYIVVAIAFSIAFVGLGRAGMHDYTADNFLAYDGSSTPIMWATFGYLEPARVRVIKDATTVSVIYGGETVLVAVVDSRPGTAWMAVSIGVDTSLATTSGEAPG